MSRASIGTNTDLTHSPRYKPFSTLVFAVWDPLRAHERDGTIARRYGPFRFKSRPKKKYIYGSPLQHHGARSALFHILPFCFQRFNYSTILFSDTFENRSRARYIDHSCTYTWDIMVIDRLSLT